MMCLQGSRQNGWPRSNSLMLAIRSFPSKGSHCGALPAGVACHPAPVAVRIAPGDVSAGCQSPATAPPPITWIFDGDRLRDRHHVAACSSERRARLYTGLPVVSGWNDHEDWCRPLHATLHQAATSVERSYCAPMLCGRPTSCRDRCQNPEPSGQA